MSTKITRYILLLVALIGLNTDFDIAAMLNLQTEASEQLITAMFRADLTTVKQCIISQPDSLMLMYHGSPLVLAAVECYLDCKDGKSDYSFELRSAINKRNKEAIVEDAKAILLFLIEQQASINGKGMWEISVTYGKTALHFAIGYNLPEIAELLLKHGADMFVKDLNGVTPYKMACEMASNKKDFIMKKIFDAYHPINRYQRKYHRANGIWPFIQPPQ